MLRVSGFSIPYFYCIPIYLTHILLIMRTQYEDESYSVDNLDIRDVIEEMQEHKDIKTLCELYAKGLLTGAEALHTLSQIYEDAKAYLRESKTPYYYE